MYINIHVQSCNDKSSNQDNCQFCIPLQPGPHSILRRAIGSHAKPEAEPGIGPVPLVDTPVRQESASQAALQMGKEHGLDDKTD